MMLGVTACLYLWPVWVAWLHFDNLRQRFNRVISHSLPPRSITELAFLIFLCLLFSVTFWELLLRGRFERRVPLASIPIFSVLWISAGLYPVAYIFSAMTRVL